MRKPTSRKRTVKTLVFWLVAVMIATSAWSFFSYYDYLFANSEYDQAVAEYKKAGLPWEAADLQTGPPVKDEENAAPLLKRASDAPLSGTPLNASKLRGAQIAKDYKGLMSHAAAYRLKLALATQASLRPKLDYHRKWEDGYNLTFPDASKTKDLIKILSIRAEANAGLGNGRLAVDDLSTAWRLAKLTGSEHLILPMLVAIAEETIVLSAIERCAAILKEDSESLEAMSRLLEAYERPAYIAAMRGDVFLNVNSIRLLKPKDVEDTAPLFGNHSNSEGFLDAMDKFGDRAFPGGLKLKAWLTRDLQFNSAMYAGMDPTDKDIRAVGRRLDKIGEQFNKRRGKSYFLQQLFLPSYEMFAESIVRIEAQAQTTRALLAALLVRQKTGRLPASIEEIPGRWTDPCNGKSLLVKRNGPEIRIYSVGVDGNDLGGKKPIELPTADRKNADIVSMFPPLPLKRY